MELKDIFGGHLDTLKYGTSDKLMDNDTFIGVEIELEGISSFNFDDVDTNLWNIKTDGSLRDGYEFVFRNPLKGINIQDAIEGLSGFFESKQETKGSPILSERTSVHVHLDVRDFNRNQTVELIKVYMLFEGIIFNYVGTYRSKNNYCRPLIGSDFQSVLHDIYTCDTLYRLIDVISEYCSKYSALNVRAVRTFGSLEFRHHPGCYTDKEIMNWINIILSLKRFIKDGGKVSELLSLTAEVAITRVFSEPSLLLKNDYESLFNNNRLPVLRIIEHEKLKNQTKGLLNKRTSVKSKLIVEYSKKFL